MEGLGSGSVLVFGRVTYEPWQAGGRLRPRPTASPEVARGMNAAEKIVFSRTLHQAAWSNTRLLTDLVNEARKLKQASARDMTILGSGSIVSQLAEHGLIYQYQFMLDPVALGDGTSVFNGLSERLNLQLLEARPFKERERAAYLPTSWSAAELESASRSDQL